ncbi:MAG: hypothetical protein ACI8ZF_000771 [Candidatus Midichloriaceae bacterium]|jgi:hypothetical protein
MLRLKFWRIERYTKLALRNDKIVGMYKAAVERIFSANPHLLPHAQDIFEQVFDKYAGQNAKLNEVKSNVLNLATSFLKDAIKNESQIDGISAIKWAIKNDAKIDGKPAMEFAEVKGGDVGQAAKKLAGKGDDRSV